MGSEVAVAVAVPVVIARVGGGGGGVAIVVVAVVVAITTTAASDTAFMTAMTMMLPNGPGMPRNVAMSKLSMPR